MANGKVIKYRKIYQITVEGSTDTSCPKDKPFGITTAETMLKVVVQSLDCQFKSRHVTLKEVE